MKVNVLKLEQKSFYNIKLHHKHIVELTLGEYYDDPVINRLMMASIGAGYNHYKIKMNLFERYANIESIRTNGKYDKEKAWALCQLEFSIGKSIEWDGELYVFSVSELFDGKYDALESTQNQRMFDAYYRAGIGHDREKVKQECYNNLAFLIEKGILRPVIDKCR